MEAQSKLVTNTTRKIGNKTFVVFAVHNPKEAIDEKIEKLIQKELSKTVNQQH